MRTPFVLLRLTQGLAIFTALVSICLFAAKPDIEEYLRQNVPWTSMPDAFNGLNNSIPINLLFVTGTLLLLVRVNRCQWALQKGPLMSASKGATIGDCCEPLRLGPWYVLKLFKKQKGNHPSTSNGGICSTLF